MSLTRKMLKAMGIEEDKIDQIIEAHSETVDALKADRDLYKKSADKLKEVQSELDELKSNSDEKYKEKYDLLQRDFDNYKAEIQKNKDYLAKENLYRDFLKQIGIKEKYIDTVIKADKSLIDELSVVDGKFKDLDNLSKEAVSKWSDFITITETHRAGINNPPLGDGNAKLTKADIYKKDDKGKYVLSTAERQKALVENPELLN